MADVSLDEYIRQKGTRTVTNKDNRYQQRSVTQNARGRMGVQFQRGSRGGQVRGKGRGGSQDRAVITISKTFDARQRLSTRPKPKDARDTIIQKTKFVDARMRIDSAKAKKPYDARTRIHGPETSPSSSGKVVVTRLGRTRQAEQTVHIIGNMGAEGAASNLTRTVNHTDAVMQSSTGNLQRTVNNYGSSFNYGSSSMDSSFSDLDIDDDGRYEQRPMNFKITKNVCRPLTQTTTNTKTRFSNLLPSLQVNKSSLMYPDQEENLHFVSSLPENMSLITRTTVQNTALRRQSSPRGGGSVPLKLHSTGMMHADSIASPERTGKRAAVSKTSSLTVRKSNPLSGGSPVIVPAHTKPPGASAPVSGPLKLVRPQSGSKATQLQPPAASKPAKKLVQAEEEDDTVGDVLSPLQGFRVMVSNLHAVVSQDDVIELFGSIGPLKKARLVKAGTADVVYVKKEDALLSIKKYNNRELDGQPMHVKLLTSMSATVFPTPPVSKEIQDLSQAAHKSDKSDATPIDISLIHKALFKVGASSNPSKPVTFTVKI